MPRRSAGPRDSFVAQLSVTGVSCGVVIAGAQALRGRPRSSGKQVTRRLRGTPSSTDSPQGKQERLCYDSIR